MEIYRTRIVCKTTRDNDVIDITPQVIEAVRASALKEGVVVLFISGSTAALTTIEYESGVVNEFLKAIERISPRILSAPQHPQWKEGDGVAHVRASLFGPSLSIPLENRKLLVGPWQQIVLLDFGDRPREREVIAQIIGTQ